MPLIVFAAKCGDPTHSGDAHAVRLIRRIEGIVDTFESFMRKGDEKFCIAAITLDDSKELRRIKRELEAIPEIQQVVRLTPEEQPFF